MSIKPIINDENALNDKSLSVYASQVRATTLVGIEVVSLRGNVIPDSVTTPGYVLENTNGIGNLTWVYGTRGGPYSSAISTPLGFVNLSEPYAPVYTRVSNITTITGKFSGDVIANTCAIDIQEAPNSGTPAKMFITGSAVKFGNNSQTLLAFQVEHNVDRFTIYWTTVNNAPTIPANMIGTVFTYVLTYQNIYP